MASRYADLTIAHTQGTATAILKHQDTLNVPVLAKPSMPLWVIALNTCIDLTTAKGGRRL